MEFKDRLKYLREQKGWTKKDTAEKIGVTTGAYSNWEYGNREPSFETLKKISDTLETSIMYLLEGKLTSTDMEHAEKGKVFSMEQFFEGFSNEITENAMNYSLDFLNNYNEYDKLEISTINNLFMLLETLRTIDNSKLSKNTKEFIAILIKNLSLNIKNNPDIELDSFFSSTIEQLSCSDN